MAEEKKIKRIGVLTSGGDAPGMNAAVRAVVRTALARGIECIDRLRDTMQAHERCSLVEVMGRHAGFLALYVGISIGATAVLIPEKKLAFDRDVIERIREYRLAGNTHFMIVVRRAPEALWKSGSSCRKEPVWSPASLCWDTSYVAAEGMRILGNPLPGDTKVISGESGAATLGFVAEVLRNPGLKALKESLGLNQDSRILCFSTEGDTDRENYRRIVWDGLYPSFDK